MWPSIAGDVVVVRPLCKPGSPVLHFCGDMPSIGPDYADDRDINVRERCPGTSVSTEKITSTASSQPIHDKGVGPAAKKKHDFP